MVSDASHLDVKNSYRLSRLCKYVAYVGKYVPANKTLWIAVDVWEGVVVVVFPEIPGCRKLSLTRGSVGGQPLLPPSIMAIQLALHFMLSMSL